jgi:heme A synthase
MAETLDSSRRKFRITAWSVLIFNVVVVLGGAIVRATGSGDGCGESWPRCTDRLLPTNPGVETVIEFSHRITSALAILGVIALFVFAVRLYGKGDRVRNAAAASLGLLLFEAVLGAALVVFGWVDQDASIGRMIIVPLHLINTYILLGALTLTAWWSSGNPGPAPSAETGTRRHLAFGAVGLLFVGAIGALNALSDSLYPAESFFSGVAEEFSGDAPWLLQVRVFHPIIAVAIGFGVAYLVMRLTVVATDRTKRFGAAVGGLIVFQFFVGLVNVMLAAPLESQVIHLAIADAIWIVYVVFSASLLGERQPADRSIEHAA